MSNQKAIEEIKYLLAAEYRLLYVVTWEELRLREEVMEAVEEKHAMDVYEWDIANGLSILTTEDDRPSKIDEQGVETPEGVLDYIEKQEKPGIFILKDYHSFMEEAEVTRRLRNISQNQDDIYKPIMITSPVMKVPTELEKVLQVIDFDLPSSEQIGQQIDDVVEAIEDNIGSLEDWNEEKKESVIKACQGLTMDEIDNVLAKSWAQKNDLDVDVILNEKKQIIRKSGVLEYYDNLEEFSNVGGMDLLKNWLGKRGKAFSDEAREYGLPQPKGMLLLGIQGCGKTLVCKSIAGLWKMPMMRLDVGKIMQGVVGSSEENMRKAISTAESISPCILMIDEIEKGLSGTGSSNFSDGGTTSRVFSTFLTWLQDKQDPVFVVATANSVQELPPELLRKGRLDEIFFVSLPDREERKEIFDIHIRKRGRDPENFDLEKLADITEGYSGAEIEEAVYEGLFDAFDEGSELGTNHIEVAVSHSVPMSTTMREKINSIREWAKNRARFASSYEQQRVDEEKKNGEVSQKAQRKNRFKIID